MLRSRLLAAAREEAAATASDQRRSQVRTVDRSERVRTYNFPENRISRPPGRLQGLQPRPGLDGDLDAVIDALVARAHRRAAGGRLLSVRDAARPTPRAGSPRPGSSRPRVDAELLLAHVLGCPARPAAHPRTTSPDDAAARFADLRRAAGRPGAAAAPHRPRGLPPPGAGGRPGRLRAAPGDRAAGRLGARAAGRARRRRSSSTSGSGSGAIALSVAHEHPGARVTPSSATPARSPGPGTTPWPGSPRGTPRSASSQGDMTDPALLPELDGRVDVVVSNPPYVPDGAGAAARGGRPRPAAGAVGRPRRPRRRPRDAARRRPAAAPRRVAGHRARRPAGRPRCPRVVRAHGGFTDVEDHPDLAGRPRFTTARAGPDAPVGKTRSPWPDLYDCSDPDGARRRPRRRGRRDRPRRAGGAAHRHRLRRRRRRLHPGRGHRAAGRQEPRPQHAGAGADRRGVHAGRPGGATCRRRPPSWPRRSGPAGSPSCSSTRRRWRGTSATPRAPSPSGCPTTTSPASCCAAPARSRCPAPTAPGRPAATTRRRRSSSSATHAAVVLDGGRAPARPPARSSTAPARVPRVLRVGAVPVDRLREVVPELTD